MRDRLQQEIKAALRAQDKSRLGALRLISAALQEREIALRTDTLSEADTLATLQKMLKQRREAAAVYAKAGRADLERQETLEIAVIEEFLPKQLPAEEVERAITAIIKDVGATSPRDIGKVMATLKERYAGQIDFAQASGRVKALLQSGAA
jgi:uncharacterized protein YqeY